MYLDSAEETLSYYDHIDEPYDYVKYTPILFNKWVNWAKNYKQRDEDMMRPMGIKVGPDWMRGEFEGIDGFYQFYKEVIEHFNNG